jgi:hypothetical protein
MTNKFYSNSKTYYFNTNNIYIIIIKDFKYDKSYYTISSYNFNIFYIIYFHFLLLYSLDMIAS